jgi:hypothetical protein
MHLTLFPQQVGWLGVKEFISNLGIKGTILMNGMGCGQHWNVDQIFPTYIANIGQVLTK